MLSDAVHFGGLKVVNRGIDGITEAVPRFKSGSLFSRTLHATPGRGSSRRLNQ